MFMPRLIFSMLHFLFVRFTTLFCYFIFNFFAGLFQSLNYDRYVTQTIEFFKGNVRSHLNLNNRKKIKTKHFIKKK